MYIGQPLERADARLKVRGEAKYSAEFSPPGMVYAFALRSTIACGTIASIDTAEALKVPGVVSILTHQNAPKVPEAKPDASRFNRPIKALQSGRVEKFGQLLGVAIATSFEAAREGAQRVHIQYRSETARLDFDKELGSARVPKKMNNNEPDSQRGDVAKALASSAHKLDFTYETPIEHHNPLEPHAIIAAWKDDQLDCYISAQAPFNLVGALAATFALSPKKVRVQSLYIGGGFGGKGPAWEHLALAAMAARLVNRPVKLVLTRQQMFYAVGLRQRNRQRLRLGADEQGRLTALSHETLTFTSTTEEFVESCGAMSRMCYAHPNSHVTHRVFPLNLPTPTYTRAPGETPGSFALESALDELAHQLGMDPVELRIRNDAPRNPFDDKPWSSRKLVECLRSGAEKFGWENRPRTPGERRQGDWQVGYGVASAARGAPQRESHARVRVRSFPDGVKAIVELAATDLGTGSYTILAQTAADGLGLKPPQIKIRIGDTALPEAPGSNGSAGAASFCSSVHTAIQELRRQLAALGNCATDLPIAELLGRAKRKEFTVEAKEGPRPEAKDYAIYGFGATFAEVRVDALLGQVRVHRLLGVHAAGTILNPRLARSQVMGGMVWGIGQALTENSRVDPRHGNFTTRDLNHYHLPVNLDVGKVDIHFLPEEDRVLNELGIKGLGELGMIGVAAAITNAIFNATGKRIRSLPVHPSDFMT